MLEVDGLALVQTDAILRYLGESSKKKKVWDRFTWQPRHALLSGCWRLLRRMPFFGRMPLVRYLCECVK